MYIYLIINFVYQWYDGMLLIVHLPRTGSSGLKRFIHVKRSFLWLRSCTTDRDWWLFFISLTCGVNYCTTTVRCVVDSITIYLVSFIQVNYKCDTFYLPFFCPLYSISAKALLKIKHDSEVGKGGRLQSITIAYISLKLELYLQCLLIICNYFIYCTHNMYCIFFYCVGRWRLRKPGHLDKRCVDEGVPAE